MFKLAIVIWWHNLLESFSSALSLFYSMYFTAGNVDEIQMLCKTAANMCFYLSLQCFYSYTENAYTVNVVRSVHWKKIVSCYALLTKVKKNPQPNSVLDLDLDTSWLSSYSFNDKMYYFVYQFHGFFFPYKFIIHCILFFHFDPHTHNSTIEDLINCSLPRFKVLSKSAVLVHQWKWKP